MEVTKDVRYAGTKTKTKTKTKILGNMVHAGNLHIAGIMILIMIRTLTELLAITGDITQADITQADITGAGVDLHIGRLAKTMAIAIDVKDTLVHQ